MPEAPVFLFPEDPTSLSETELRHHYKALRDQAVAQDRLLRDWLEADRAVDAAELACRGGSGIAALQAASARVFHAEDNIRAFFAEPHVTN